MGILRCGLLLVVTAAAAIGVRSEEQSGIPTTIECSAAASHAEESRCLFAAFPKADAELQLQVTSAAKRFEAMASKEQSATYKAWLMSSAAELRKAQSYWRSYRDANCAVVDGQIHGSDHGTAKVRCQLEMTTAMISTVKGYASTYMASARGAN